MLKVQNILPISTIAERFKLGFLVGGKFPNGFPVVFPVTEGEILETFSVFPSYKLGWTRNHKILSNGIVVAKMPELQEAMVIRREKVFKKELFPEIREAINRNHPYSLTLFDSNKLTEGFKTLRDISRTYKHCIHVLSNNVRYPYIKKYKDFTDNVIMIMTFYPLLYCIPVFNMRRIDGMGVVVSFANLYEVIHEENNKGLFSHISLLLSNFDENITYVDGNVVNYGATAAPSHFDNIISVGCKKPALVEEPKQRVVETKLGPVEYVMSKGPSTKLNDTSYYVYTTSSTTTWR